jgi:exodeoxyribonuclease VII large subunit
MKEIWDFGEEEMTTGILSLSELNFLVKEAINEILPETYWIRAETSDVRINASSGHCYLEFVEKDEKTNHIIAKARGTIWARNFLVIKPFFEQETGKSFGSGIKVLVNVSVEFHEVYGYSLNVNDIDPSYTIGDMVKKRNEIIERLKKEGIFDLNKELDLSPLPQRIAVVTSPTAAGYEDFIHQLTNNENGFPFYIKLFPALMQGDAAEESIISALEKIYRCEENFDVVVIIRGGGAASELSAFDSYSLAAHCAQFPLPVITGIGHERDESIVDMVAHTRMKTPTAVAAFLIDRVQTQAEQLDNFISVFLSLPQHLRHETERLDNLSYSIKHNTEFFLLKNKRAIGELLINLKNETNKLIINSKNRIELKEQFVKMGSPEYVLKRGYSLVYRNHKIVEKAESLSSDDEITIKFHDGERNAKILS